MTLILQEIASYSALFIAILQLVFVILFALFFRQVTSLKEEIEAIMSFLVSSDENFRATLELANQNNKILKQNQRRQNTLARLIIRNQNIISEHHRTSKDFLDSIQAGIEAGEIKLVNLREIDTDIKHRNAP